MWPKWSTIAKGQKFVAEKSAAEIAAAIQPSFPETVLAVIEKVVQNYKEIGAFSHNPVMEQAAFDRIIDIVKNAGEIHPDADVPFDAVIDNSCAEAAKQ